MNEYNEKCLDVKKNKESIWHENSEDRYQAAQGRQTG